MMQESWTTVQMNILHVFFITYSYVKQVIATLSNYDIHHC